MIAVDPRRLVALTVVAASIAVAVWAAASPSGSEPAVDSGEPASAAAPTAAGDGDAGAGDAVEVASGVGEATTTSQGPEASTRGREPAGTATPTATVSPEAVSSATAGDPVVSPALVGRARRVAVRWVRAFLRDGDGDQHAWLAGVAEHSTERLADRLATPEAWHAADAFAAGAQVVGAEVVGTAAGRVRVAVEVTADDRGQPHRLQLVVVGDDDTAAVHQLRL